jgi:uncharacterized OsmC-like protein
MNISATINCSYNQNQKAVQTNGDFKSVTVPCKSTGYGSSINGGELLLISLATCFYNDLYREANKRKVQIDAIEAECTGDFGPESEPGSNFQYRAKDTTNASAQKIEDLINYTDKVAVVHNTLRKGLSISLVKK